VAVEDFLDDFELGEFRHGGRVAAACRDLARLLSLRLEGLTLQSLAADCCIRTGNSAIFAPSVLCVILAT
jgi:hypothetical protein